MNQVLSVPPAFEALQVPLNARLEQILRAHGTAAPVLTEAMGAALLAPGKRFRGILMLAVGHATGGVTAALIDAACAVEMAHTSSLIFDDLPCMDDSSMRRGRPALHIAYGESTAILAGLGLLTESFRVLARAEAATDAQRARMGGVLAEALGPAGLCAGQHLDLHAPKSREGLGREQDLKTGALFVAGFGLASVALDLDAEAAERLRRIGLLLGQIFQCYDDLLDALGSSARLGKDVGSDAGPQGVARGMLSVSSAAEAADCYDRSRGELRAALAGLRFDTGLIAQAIDRVLPDTAPRARLP